MTEFSAADIALLRGWYGVTAGNGYLRDEDVELAERLFKDWPCDCDRRLGRCHACAAAEGRDD